MDGTALGGGFQPYQRFPDHFSDFLDELVENGWEWAINTTWDPEGQWKLICRSKVKSRPAFLIAEYGRQLLEIRNGEPVRVEPYSRDNDLRIEQYCRESLIPLLHALFQEILPKQVLYYEHLVSILLREPLLLNDLPELREAKDRGVFHFQISEKAISIRPAFLSKGLPMPLLQERFGFERKNIICAGDEAADLAMMKYSDGWLAPANACEEVKTFLRNNGMETGKREYAWGVIDAFCTWHQKKIQGE